MRKNLLLAGLLTTFSLVVKAQVGINTSNPQGVFNIDGSKNNPSAGVPTTAQSKDDLVMTSNGNLGLGLTAPGTTLDVNGAITNRETALTIVGNAVSIPLNVSLVRLTGAATANVAITAFAAPNPGQRLIVYNNTTGGFGATLDGVTIPNGKALEFVFSNSLWRSTDGGSVGAAPVNIYTANGILTGNRTVTQGANTLAFTGTQTNAFSVDGNTLSVDAANDYVGIGTTTPDTKLTISTPDNSFGLNHTNGSVSLKSYIGGGVVSLGTTTANDLRFTTNNTQKMSITSAGNVGIGTSTPDSKLTITAPDNSFGLHHTNGSTSLKSYIGGGVVSLGTTTANDLRFTTNNTQKMSITSAGNVGIGTVTPQKALHVSGSLQVTNELNVGGDASTAGSPGTDGQFLISKGPGIAPQWTSVNIPVLEVGAYKLKGVYQFNLNDVFTNTNGNLLTLGNFSNINVGSASNLLIIEFQSSVSVLSLSSGEGMSYRYRLSGDNGISTSLSPFFYITSSGFNPMNNLTSYKFFLTNVTPNTYNLILQANRSNTAGAATASKFIHFNRTYSDSSNFITDGKAIIYVYEQ